MKINISLFLQVLLLASFSNEIFAQDINLDLRRSYQEECEEVKKYAIDKSMGVDCFLNYHHYNAQAYKSQYFKEVSNDSDTVKIAEFNVLHPGMSKTRYKDYKKVAQLINRWDVIGVTELLPLLSSDFKHNTDLVKYIEEEIPKEISELKAEVKELKAKLSQTGSSRTRTSLKKKIAAAEDQISFYTKEKKEALNHYRKPGYLKILDELHGLKNGKEWALILSPKGEAAKESDVHELVGYYYRSSKVMPRENDYCREVTKYGQGTPIACIAMMSKKMLGKDKDDIFSRRPFMAEFQSGNFSFTLLTSHVVYNSPKDEKEMANILTKSFNVKHYNELGIGINAGNYARFAEVKVMLDFMQKLRTKYKQKDVILLGDLNLESNNQFWPTVLDAMPGVQLYNDKRSSISEKRYDVNGNATDGLANDFDHMLLDPRETDECISKSGKVEVEVENFYKGVTGRFVKRLYEVRGSKKVGDKYTLNKKKYDSIVKKFVTPYLTGKKVFYTIGYKNIKVGTKNKRVKGLIEDKTLTDKYTEYFQERVLDTQLVDKTYYSYFTEVLSDHMPIYMSCSTK